ncbi:hypothetical protein B0T24DRAFT_539442 [Lasiosphaeria ovina]|uniref:Uncharacterized protein n=1 Tax=Lasiosphaeria ovina TaxID=92902 RepID=A0AAE0MY31_9PEZI|nr:hypothetical protein B0T24DRAFT_539442 [Lasiosphaeria ovina]
MATSLPQPQTTPPPAPSVRNMTMFGPGCPIGAGGLVQQMRDGTPVFVFAEWALALPAVDDATGKQVAEVSKFCTEEITLADGPVGMQLRIATVSVSGWAVLEAGSSVHVRVETALGGVAAGNQSTTIAPSDLKANAFQADLHTQPADIWSACVDASGAVPHISIKTTVSLVGTPRAADGTLSGGAVGGEKTDLKKALGLHFDPVWRPCALLR